MKKIFYEKIDAYVAGITQNYTENAGIISLNVGEMPDRGVIVETVHLLRELIFPGFFGKQDLPRQAIDYHVGEMLDRIYKKLHQQICRALKSQAKDCLPPDEGALSEKADDIICRLFDRLPHIRNDLAKDVQAYYNGDPSITSVDEVIFSIPGIFAISVYRIAHEVYNLSVPLIPRIMTEYAHGKTGIDIHPAAVIGSPFFIDHGTGVVIGETTVIGDHVRLYQGVTLGALSPQKGQSLRGIKRHPTLEDNVVVYSGASIMGGDTVIGTGSVIGSNVFLTQSVPPDSRISVKKD